MRERSAGPRNGRAFALGQALAVAFLAACLFRVWREVGLILPRDLITKSLGFAEALQSRLGLQVGAFLAALLVLHALLGALAYGLGRLTRAAFPQIASWWLPTTAWFLVMVGFVLAANAGFFPASIFAGTGAEWPGHPAPFSPVALAGIAVSGFIAVLAWRAARRRAFLWTLSRAAAAAAAAAIVVLPWLPRSPVFAAGSGSDPPHVVILGIDSLRNDLTVPRRGAADTPNILQFLRGARRFDDATTPLARTYGSWMAILTGRHPVTTNARFNLMPRRLVHEGPTLATALRAQGYRAIYATDEVRYANIDRTYGFDRVITPPVGAIDFLLGYCGDIPLVNLVAVTGVGQWLFPSNHANRAASVTYRPNDFVERLENGIDADGPAFIAIHLTLTHWPYSWAGRSTPSDPASYRVAYGEALPEVDRQFAAVLRMLEGKGVLDNAIVVLLSDHGEALGADNDSIIRQTGTSQEIWDTLWGHGTSVLSPNQYHVLLAVRAFGRARLPGPERNYDWPVSLEDLRPTLEEMATGKAPSDVDGLSLVPYMTAPERGRALADRIRFTETGLNTANIRAGRYRMSGVVNETAEFYELEPRSGWIQLREASLPELMAHKQRAALTSRGLLAALPYDRGPGIRYLYADLKDPHPRVLEGPKALENGDVRRLHEALAARFPGELQDAPGTPRM